jgi:hypothetical protein
MDPFWTIHIFAAVLGFLMLLGVGCIAGYWRDRTMLAEDARRVAETAARSERKAHSAAICESVGLRGTLEMATARANLLEQSLARKCDEVSGLHAELEKARRHAEAATDDAHEATKDAGAMLDFIAFVHETSGDILDAMDPPCGECADCRGCPVEIEGDPDMGDDRPGGTTIPFVPGRN